MSRSIHYTVMYFQVALSSGTFLDRDLDDKAWVPKESAHAQHQPSLHSPILASLYRRRHHQGVLQPQGHGNGHKFEGPRWELIDGESGQGKEQQEQHFGQTKSNGNFRRLKHLLRVRQLLGNLEQYLNSIRSNHSKEVEKSQAWHESLAKTSTQSRRERKIEKRSLIQKGLGFHPPKLPLQLMYKTMDSVRQNDVTDSKENSRGKLAIRRM